MNILCYSRALLSLDFPGSAAASATRHKTAGGTLPDWRDPHSCPIIWTFAIDLDYVRNGNAYKNSNGET